jgi:integrase
MGPMPRPRLPYITREVSRHGRAAWYFRRDKGPRIRLPDQYGSEEFLAAYNKALAGDAAKPRKASNETFRWLVEQYQKSADWAVLARGTREARNAILRGAVKNYGDDPFTDFDQADIMASVDARAKTPFAAKNFLKTMRGLFAWALKWKHISADPTLGASVKTKETEGFRTWTDEDIARFEARWPIGTRERLAFALFINTGLRRGDVARLGRQHVRDGMISLATEKTKTVVFIPILKELQAALDASPLGEMVFLTGERGQPMTKESLGNWFRDACDEAKLRGIAAHGLRKAAAVRLAEAGATVDELEAIFGWEGGKMASLYTKAANRRRLATSGMAKLSRPDQEQNPPAPSKKVRASKKITDQKQ